MKYPITPVSKPRQTQRDKWAKRPAVMAYRAFADECRLLKMSIREAGDIITFIIPMPASWSRHQKEFMDGTPHQSKPDIDNLLKSVLDAVLPQGDQNIYDIRARKFWGRVGYIEIKEVDK